jgi:hypothetical protein
MVSLSLETLERRALPSASPLSTIPPPLNDTYLATVYQGELKRDLDASGLGYWGGQLAQGSSRRQVAQGILSSDEYFGDAIGSDYDTLLGRSPDPGGWQAFLQALRNGATPQDVEASVMGSDEFFARVGGDPVRFLNAVYGRVLNRSADEQGLASFGPLTGSVAGRTQIVQQIEASPEAAQLAVTTIYQDTLGRTPDAAGLAYWAGQLERGVSQTTVLAGVLGSDEFFARMQQYVSTLNTSDPNVAASRFITEAQLFQSQPRVVPAALVPLPSPSGDNGPVDQTPVDNGSGCDNTGSANSNGAPVYDNPGGTDFGANTIGASSCDNLIPDNSGDAFASGIQDTSGCDDGSSVTGCDPSADF